MITNISYENRFIMAKYYLLDFVSDYLGIVFLLFFLTKTILESDFTVIWKHWKP